MLPEGQIQTQTDSPELFGGVTPQMKISQATTLRDLEEDFVLFTPAMFFTHAMLDRDPLQEFYNEVDGEPALTVMSFDRPIFAGLNLPSGNPGWNHKLFAIEKPYWDKCLAFLGGIGILDRKKNSFARAFPFRMQVVDELALKNVSGVPTTLPRANIVFFGLDGTKGRFLMEEHKKGLMEPPKVRILKANPATLKYGWALIKGKPLPHKLASPGEILDASTPKKGK